MNQKKSKNLILVLIIILLIFILIGGIVFAYVATDFFKDNKKLFFKYATQITDSKVGFLDDTLNQYFEKKKNTIYDNDGSFKMNISNASDKVNNTNITFSGEINNPDSKFSQDISINYSDDIKFPIRYRQIGDKIGLQTEKVSSKFLAVETGKAGDLLTGAIDIPKTSTSYIEKVQGITNIELTKEEQSRIQETYIGILNNELNNSKFSKVKEGNETGYKLSLTGEELKNITIKLLENLKEDQTTLDKLNEYLKTQKNSAKITKKDIESYIDELNNNNDINEQKIEIIIYNKQRKISRITIESNDFKLELKKNAGAGNIGYGISLEINQDNETTKVNLSANYSGIASMQEINETYEIGLESSEPEGDYKYTLANTVRFKDNSNIEDFDEENSILLTDYDEEQVSSFLQKVVERISDVNRDQMEKLGLNEWENPIIQGITAPFSAIQMQTSDISNLSGSTVNVDESEIGDFNQKFEVYESTNQSSQAVKGLLSTIQLNNESEESEQEIKEINFNGEEYEATEQNITFIKGDLKEDKSYRVEFEKDETTGIIYRIVINEK